MDSRYVIIFAVIIIGIAVAIYLISKNRKQQQKTERKETRRAISPPTYFTSPNPIKFSRAIRKKL